jgi:hypothetical protein
MRINCCRTPMKQEPVTSIIEMEYDKFACSVLICVYGHIYNLNNTNE